MDHNKWWKILKETGLPDHLTWYGDQDETEPDIE